VKGIIGGCATLMGKIIVETNVWQLEIFPSKQQNKPFAWIYGNPIATRHVDGLLHQAKCGKTKLITTAKRFVSDRKTNVSEKPLLPAKQLKNKLCPSKFRNC